MLGVEQEIILIRMFVIAIILSIIACGVSLLLEWLEEDNPNVR